MKKMKLACVLGLFAVGMAGCSSTTMVKVPPRVLLDQNQTVGIVRFDVEGANGEEFNVTTKFMEAIQQGQPGVAIVELGNSAEVLKAIEKSRLNGEAVQAIGKKFNVDVVVVGTLRFKESQPKVDVNLSEGFRLNSLRAQVRVDGRLEAKLMNTTRGASVWTGTSSRWINLAEVSGTGGGLGSLNIADKNRQCEKLVLDMVSEASGDFYPTWQKQAKN
jgi:hypothetical protein